MSSMSDRIFANISEKPLSIEKAADFVDDNASGATSIFVGRVRNHNLGKAVRAVTYDAFVPLACNVMMQLCLEALDKFGDQLRCYIEHYKGKLGLGGISVVIAVSSPHRDEAFKACRYLIEELKVRVPIWKQEHYLDGDVDWIEGYQLSAPK